MELVRFRGLAARLILSVLLGVTAWLEWSCAPLGKSGPSSFSLVPSLSVESSRQFRRAVNAAPGTKEFERARIEYLLERVAQSPYNFIRNGSRYSGKRAWVHLKWKHFRKFGQIKTAEDFIQNIATRSKASGEFYLMEMPDKKRYPLKNFFVYELSLFDEKVGKRRTVESEKSA